MTECKDNLDPKEKDQTQCCGNEQCGCGEQSCCHEQNAPEGNVQEEETIEQLRARLALAESKVVEQYDLYVRAMAEMENIRRRTSEDIQKARKFSIESFAEHLLPVVDSFEKAMEISYGSDHESVPDGMLATYRQLIHALDVSGMKPIDPQGEAFDPHKHQAISMVPAPEGVQPGYVVQVFQKGWLIHDRVLRPAMVSVSQG